MQRTHQSGYALLQFSIVGVLAAVAHFVSVWLIVSFLHISPSISNIFAFLIAFQVSYWGHYRISFRHQASSINYGMPRWLLVSLLSFGINQTLFVYGLKQWPQFHYLFILFVSTAIAALLSYILGRFWAFNQKNNMDK
jgi:putative flippase GtrA